MARFNEILVGRYNRLIQKLFGMKGDASLFQFSTEMMAVLPMFIGAENRYLEQWDRFAFSVQQAGVVGQLSTIKLRNPVGSNVIAVFEKINYANSGGDADATLQMGTDQTDGGTSTPLVATNNLDSRSNRLSTLIASRSGAAAPVSQVAILSAGVSGNVTYDYIGTDIQEITLNPGRSIQLVASAANTTILGSFMWRERLLEESERT
jgi:hypothetical protein